MEKDGKTRLYYYHDHPYQVKEAWPNPAGWDEENWTRGKVAEETYKRAEFVCVNVHEGDHCDQPNWLVNLLRKLAGKGNVRPQMVKPGRHYWAVIPHKNGESNWDKEFKIDRIGYCDEDYANLAKKLEQRTGKKGLTIFIS